MISRAEDTATPSLKTRILYNLVYVLPLIASAAPLCLLLGFSGKLSRQLQEKACSPNGDFVLPFTTSIWDAEYFFSITVPFSGPGTSGCTVSYGETYTLSCAASYSFSRVKVIDIAFDVLVGRGGQAVTIVLAYHVFGGVLRTLMVDGEVGYGLFSAVAFDSGGFGSLPVLLRHALGWTPVPRTSHAVIVYWAMTLTTVWIIAMPTLISAMTGYTARFAPFVDLGLSDFNGTFTWTNSALTDCMDSFAPVWGQLEQNDAATDFIPLAGYWPIVDDPKQNTIAGPEWVEYYNRYFDPIYSQCPERLNISGCSAAQERTYLVTHYGTDFTTNETIPIPAPGIIKYPEFRNPVSKYRWWNCNEYLIDAMQLINFPDFATPPTQDALTGMCRSGSGYVWGFSFLLTLVASVLHLIFVLVLYALWMDVGRHWRARKGQRGKLENIGQFKDAVQMVVSAQRHYGTGIAEWDAASLEKEIMKGKLGMGHEVGSGHGVVRRDASRRSKDLGDPNGGHWGGDVDLDDRQ